jgi:hypothetical protein
VASSGCATSSSGVVSTVGSSLILYSLFIHSCSFTLLCHYH